MSQLKVTQRLMSLRDKFMVTDLLDQTRYQVSEKLFTWGKVYSILDSKGREVARIEEKVLSFRPTFYVTVGGNPVAKIRKEWTLFRSQYSIEGANLRCEGDFFSMNFQVFEGSRQIADVNKKFFTLRDTYLLDVPDEGQELMVLALVLAIDICEHSPRSRGK